MMFQKYILPQSLSLIINILIIKYTGNSFSLSLFVYIILIFSISIYRFVYYYNYKQTFFKSILYSVLTSKLNLILILIFILTFLYFIEYKIHIRYVLLHTDFFFWYKQDFSFRKSSYYYRCRQSLIRIRHKS